LEEAGKRTSVSRNYFLSACEITWLILWSKRCFSLLQVPWSCEEIFRQRSRPTAWCYFGVFSDFEWKLPRRSFW
jgi:hypothetical protein